MKIFSKKFQWFESLLVIVFMPIQIFAATSDAWNFANNWFIRDDAYYYFKIAQNISMGLGSTMDGTHLTNGYHPLWMLVCIPIFALARFDLILPLRVLLIVMSLLSVSTAIILYRLLSAAVSRLTGMLAAIYWVFSPFVVWSYYRQGLESGIGLFFTMLFLYMVYKFEQGWRKTQPNIQQIALLGFVAALVAFSRLDLIFFTIIAGIWIVFRATPIRYLLPLDILAIFAAVLTAFITRLGLPDYYNSTNATMIMIAAALIIKIPVFYFWGLYQQPASWKPLKVLQNILLAVAASSVVLSILLLTGRVLHILPAFSAIILLLDAAFTFGFILLIRGLTFAFRTPGTNTVMVPPLEQLKKYWKDWSREGSAYYGVLGGLMAIYMLWSKFVFGTFTPISGQIKRWWGTFAIIIYGGTPKDTLSFLTLDPNGSNSWGELITLLRDWSNLLFYRDPASISTILWRNNFLIIIAVTIIILCGIFLLRRDQSVKAVVKAGLIPLLVGSWLQILSYNITGYSALKGWYWLTEQILSVFVIAILINTLFDLLLKRWAVTRALTWVLVALLGAQMSFSYWKVTSSLMPHGTTPPNAPYVDVIPFLETYTKPGDIIGMTGGGSFAYFIHDRTVVNMDGLANSYDYFQAMKKGVGSDYLYDTGMRYVFANSTMLIGTPYRGQYTNRLETVASWDDKDLMRFLPKPTK